MSPPLKTHIAQISMWLLAMCATTFIAAEYAHAECESYKDPETLGTVTAPQIDEASGIVASGQYEGIFWTHNDSGDAPQLYAITSTGELVGTWTIDGASARDWEDIAYGVCADGKRACLYIGDFGNNSKQRDDLTVYRVPEPEIDLNAARPITASSTTAQSFPFKYPDEIGNHDAETLLVTPGGGVFVMTKGTQAHLVKLPMIEGTEQVAPLIRSNSLPSLTGGDLSIDGRTLVVRNYLNAWVFPMPDVEQPGLALEQPPKVIRLQREPQGEAITITNTQDLITVSEKTDQPIWRYPCVPVPVMEDMGMPQDMTNDMKSDMQSDMSSDMTNDMQPDISPDMLNDMTSPEDMPSIATPPSTKTTEDEGCAHVSGGAFGGKSGQIPTNLPFFTITLLLSVFVWNRRRHQRE